MRTPNENTAVLGTAPKTPRRVVELAPGMTLEPAASIPAAELATMHTAEIARRLGFERLAWSIEESETEALMEGGEWVIE